MPAKIIISKESDAKWHNEREFGQKVITIGRDNSNTLLLEDTENFISRRHAKLKYEKGNYHIMDCGSRNFTYVNDNRLPRKIPVALHDGDQIKIGQYNMKFINLEAARKKESTILFVNPFIEEMKIFEGLLNKIKNKFDDLDESSRDEQLRFALQELLFRNKPARVGEIIGEEFSGAKPAKSKKKAKEPAPKDTVPSEIKLQPQAERTWQLLTASLLSLAKPAWNFQNKFIDVRMKQAQASNILHNLSSEELKNFLLSDQVNEEEAEKRHAKISCEVEELVTQHNALFDVFRENVEKGTRRLLRSVDPLKLHQEYAKQAYAFGPVKIPYRLIPGLVRKKNQQFLKAKGIRSAVTK